MKNKITLPTLIWLTFVFVKMGRTLKFGIDHEVARNQTQILPNVLVWRSSWPSVRL